MADVVTRSPIRNFLGTVFAVLIIGSGLAVIVANPGQQQGDQAGVAPTVTHTGDTRELIIRLDWTDGFQANIEITATGPAFPATSKIPVRKGEERYPRPFFNGALYGPLHIISEPNYEETHLYFPEVAGAGESLVTVRANLQSFGRDITARDKLACQITIQGVAQPKAADTMAKHKKANPNEPNHVACGWRVTA